MSWLLQGRPNGPAKNPDARQCDPSAKPDSPPPSPLDSYRSINALAETTVGSFKNELIRRQGPWRDADHVELETLHWVHWFNTERPHEYLDDLTPEQAEQLHYDLRALAAAG